jgi:hypothetical protein
MVFHIGWMEHYKGISEHDTIIGGGEYVNENGYGHEILNFKEYHGCVYGYVAATKVPNNGKEYRTIRIQRLGAHKNDEEIPDISVIWVSTDPEGERVIVGWYLNATVFRYGQSNDSLHYRKYNNILLKYYVCAKSSDVTLLPISERTFCVPRGENGFGRCNVWYADEEANKVFVEDTKKFIFEYMG